MQEVDGRGHVRTPEVREDVVRKSRTCPDQKSARCCHSSPVYRTYQRRRDELALRVPAASRAGKGEIVMDKLLLTPTEAAAALAIGRSKVYELMRAGTLGSIRIDTCRRIPAAELEALVDRLRANHSGLRR